MKQQKPIVLIVDDTLANLALLSHFLETSGNYRVLGAESGVRAIEQVQRLRPDIILLDMLMLGLDGFETCRLLKANPETREIPIIFLTALTETVDKVRGFELGGVDVAGDGALADFEREVLSGGGGSLLLGFFRNGN